QMTPFAQDAKPVQQARRRIDQVLQAMAAVNEVKLAIRYIGKKLPIPIFPVPGADGLHAAEQLPVQYQGVRLATYIKASAHEVSAGEVGVAEPAHDGFAAFFHFRLQSFAGWR